jgi:hypothetical protein
VDKSNNFNSLVTAVDLAQLDSLEVESIIRETCPALVNRSGLDCIDAHRSFAIIRRDCFVGGTVLVGSGRMNMNTFAVMTR